MVALIAALVAVAPERAGVSLAEAAEIARLTSGGVPIEVEYDDDAWEVEILMTGGRVVEFEIDGESGEVLDREPTDEQYTAPRIAMSHALRIAGRHAEGEPVRAEYEQEGRRYWSIVISTEDGLVEVRLSAQSGQLLSVGPADDESED